MKDTNQLPPSEREAFEAFAQNCPMGKYSIARRGEGYDSSHTQLMWDAWQARAQVQGEPVGFTYQAEIEYADSTGGNGAFWRVPPDLDDEAVPLYTHPAPSAPVTPEPVLDATLAKHLQASAPAPWEVSFHETVTGKPFGIVTGGQPGSGRMDIVICHGPDAYDEPLSFKAFLANAPLIAAAPKLLDALELIANAGNSALDLAYCKGVASAAIGASATTSS